LVKNVPVVIVNVYSSYNIKDKICLWEELAKLRENKACKSWCILGDFNAIRKKEERRGVCYGRSDSREISSFNNFIEGLELLDIPCLGRKYTWYRPNEKAKSRINRFLVSNEWLQT